MFSSFCTADCSYEVLRSASSRCPASFDAYQENKVSRTPTDWHQVAANKQAAHSAAMWLFRLRLHPSNAQHAGGSFYWQPNWKYSIILSLISHVCCGEGRKERFNGRTMLMFWIIFWTGCNVKSKTEPGSLFLLNTSDVKICNLLRFIVQEFSSARSVCAKHLRFSFLLTKFDIVKPTGSNDLQKRLSFSGSPTACHNYLTWQLTSLQNCQSRLLFLFFLMERVFRPISKK